MKQQSDVSTAFEERLRALLAVAEERSRAWASSAQRTAREAILRRGLPRTKDEAWRFTPLRALLDFDFAPSTRKPDWADLERRADEELGLSGAARVYLVGNQLRFVARGDRRGVGVSSVTELSELACTALPGAGLSVESRDGFAHLNEALAQDGVVVRVRPDAAVSVEIEIVVASASEDDPALEVPRYWLDLEAHSVARVTELHLPSEGPAPVLRSMLGRIRLGQGAALEHVRVLLGAGGGHSVALIDVEQAQESRYDSRVATFGGSLSRLDLRVRLGGAGAACDLEGLYMACAGEVVDHRTLVDHSVGGCTSRQRFKGIADHDGRAIFDGTVVVRRDAQRSVARQENRNLVLSDDAVVHTKPHLEIDADDVVCSHGATVGRLASDEVFYLRSRGIDAASARAMLTHAFGLEVLDTFSCDRLRRRLDRALVARLAGRDSLAGGP